MSKIVIVFLLFLSLLSCKEDNTEDFSKLENETCKKSNVYNINLLRDAKSKLNISEYFSVESVIKLESDSIHSIAKISEIFFLNESFYIVDRRFDLLYVFDLYGKFKFQIGAVGNGPGEYLNISSVSLSEKKDKIIIYSSESRKLLSFSTEGEFIGSKSLDIFGYNFVINDSKEYVFYINYNLSDLSGYNNILITDSNGNINDTAFPFSEKRDIFSIASSGILIQNHNREILFSEPYSDTIYTYKNRQFCPRYSFNFGDSKVPKKIYNNRVSFMGAAINYMHLRPDIIETNNWLLTGFTRNRIYEYVVYNKITGNFVKKSDFNISPLQKLYYTPVGVLNENTFIGEISPSRLGIFSDKDPQFIDNLKSEDSVLYNGIKDIKNTDNPVIVLFQIEFPNVNEKL